MISTKYSITTGEWNFWVVSGRTLGRVWTPGGNSGPKGTRSAQVHGRGQETAARWDWRRTTVQWWRTVRSQTPPNDVLHRRRVCGAHRTAFLTSSWSPPSLMSHVVIRESCLFIYFRDGKWESIDIWRGEKNWSMRNLTQDRDVFFFF